MIKTILLIAALGLNFLPAYAQFDDEEMYDDGESSQSFEVGPGPDASDENESGNISFPFFSQFLFGGGLGSVPYAGYEKASTAQSLYLLNLGINIPFWFNVDSALAAGARVLIQYPTSLNIKDGEPSYHFDLGPSVDFYKNVVRDRTWDIDVIGGLSWNFRRSQYALGTLSSNGPVLMVGSKVRWLPYTVLDSTPVLNARFWGFGPLNNYSVSSKQKDNPIVGNDSLTDFASSGSMSSLSFDVSVGLSAPSDVPQTENEYLLGTFFQATNFSKLKDSTNEDITMRHLAFFVAWRRTWVK